MDDAIKKTVDYCFADLDELLPDIVLAELDRAKKDEKRLNSLTILCIRKIVWDWIWPRSTAGIHLKLLFREPIDISRASQSPLYFLFFEPNPIEDPRCFKNDANLMMRMMEDNLDAENAHSMSFCVFQTAFVVKLDGQTVVNVGIENFDLKWVLAFGRLAFERNIYSLEFLLGVIQKDPVKSTDKEMEFVTKTKKTILGAFPEAVVVEGWGMEFEKKEKKEFYVGRADCECVATLFNHVPKDPDYAKHSNRYRLFSFLLRNF